MKAQEFNDKYPTGKTTEMIFDNISPQLWQPCNTPDQNKRSEVLLEYTSYNLNLSNGLRRAPWAGAALMISYQHHDRPDHCVSEVNRK